MNVLPGFEVLLDNSTDYTNFTNEYWSAQQAAVNPYCIVKPSCASQVSTVVLISRLTKCPFAVKGGGHAAFEGSSSIDGGITIALEKLDEVNVAADKNSVYVGPGNRWFDFYTALEKDGLAVVGGRVSLQSFYDSSIDIVRSTMWVFQGLHLEEALAFLQTSADGRASRSDTTYLNRR